MAKEEPMEREETRGHLLVDSMRTSAFVIGTALVFFVLARNYVTWYVQQFWGASGDFWQNQWIKIHDLCGGDEAVMGFWVMAAVSAGSYWFFNAGFLLLDIYGPPQFLLKYKIQEEHNVPVDPYKLRRAIKLILFNQIVAGAPVTYLVYRGMVWRGISFGRELPSFQWVVWEIFLLIWIEEIGFYYSHRLLHLPMFYKRIHKRHHEWTASISVVSIYAHPLEHIVSNLMPPLLGPLLLGTHIATFYLWFSLVILSTTISHSGYHFPLLPSPEMHDFHHLKFNVNYGVLGVLDRLHGTDESFRKSKQYKRHFLSVSLVPVRQQVPDRDGEGMGDCGSVPIEEKERMMAGGTGSEGTNWSIWDLGRLFH